MGNVHLGDIRIRGASGDEKELMELPVPDAYLSKVLPNSSEKGALVLWLS